MQGDPTATVKRATVVGGPQDRWSDTMSTPPNQRLIRFAGATVFRGSDPTLRIANCEHRRFGAQRLSRADCRSPTSPRNKTQQRRDNTQLAPHSHPLAGDGGLPRNTSSVRTVVKSTNGSHPASVRAKQRSSRRARGSDGQKENGGESPVFIDPRVVNIERGASPLRMPRADLEST